jgi:orotate phosphoribosyltransferase
MNQALAAQIAQHLLSIKAVKLNPADPFTWASGLRSPIYCDNRKTLSYPNIRNDIKMAFAEVSKQFGDFDCVAGVATAGIAHGALLADVLGKPFIYVRSSAKGHGLKNLIEGELLPSFNKVLVVEDLISTGGSSFAAVEVLREAGADVAGVVAIFTYGFESAAKVFSEGNCPLATLSNFPALLQVAIEANYINPEQQATLLQWQESPSAWSANFLDSLGA